MESTLSPVDEGKVRISVRLDESEVEQALGATFRQLAKQVRIKGFRPGKAPRKVLEAHLAPGFARRQALGDLLGDSYRQAVVRHDVDAIASPEIDITAGEEEGPVAFEAVVEVRPCVNVAGYDTIKVSIERPEATPEEIGKEIDAQRAKFGELEEVARPAVDGDHVEIDVDTTLGGEEVPNLCVQDYHYELGSGGVVPEIDENLRGATVGSILEFNAAHPDPEEDGLLRFRVLVKGVNALRLPPFDDQFAARASEFDTAEELRADTAGRIRNVKRSYALSQLRGEVTGALARLVTEEIPDALVDAEVSGRMEDLATYMEKQGQDFEQYLESAGRSRQELADEFRPGAQNNVRIDLGLRAVADAENLEVEEADISEDISRMAAEISEDPGEVRRRMEETGGWSRLRAEMRKQKALRWLMENVEITDADGNPIDYESVVTDESPA